MKTRSLIKKYNAVTCHDFEQKLTHAEWEELFLMYKNGMQKKIEIIVDRNNLERKLEQISNPFIENFEQELKFLGLEYKEDTVQ